MRMLRSKCLACGKPIKDGSKRALFCSNPCAKVYSNTRMKRGAQVHDLLVEWRRSYKNRHLLTEIGRIVKGWIDEDAGIGRGCGDAVNDGSGG